MPEMPWPYSTPSTPDKGVHNLPSPEGAALGRELVRLLDGEEERQRRQFPNMPKMCDDCLCRLGTGPNQSAASLMDLLKCAQEGVPFYCHKGIPDEAEPKRVCTGYLLMVGQRPGDECDSCKIESCRTRLGLERCRICGEKFCEKCLSNHKCTPDDAR